MTCENDDGRVLEPPRDLAGHMHQIRGISEFDELTHLISKPVLKCGRPQAQIHSPNPLGPRFATFFGFEASMESNADIFIPTYKIYRSDKCKCSEAPDYLLGPRKIGEIMPCLSTKNKTFAAIKGIACYGSDGSEKHFAAYTDRILVGTRPSSFSQVE